MGLLPGLQRHDGGLGKPRNPSKEILGRVEPPPTVSPGIYIGFKRC